MAKREPNPSLLLVEGNDDWHVIAALMQHHQIPEAFAIEDCKGIDPLFESIPAHLRLRKRLGIMVDADESVDKRWRQLAGILAEEGYRVPESPDPKGTIIRRDGGPVVGIWLMPNNTLPGKLEDFIRFLVPPGNSLLTAAATAVGQLPASPDRFAQKDESKALIHTWLAWQVDPGIPMGYAITRKFLDAAVPEVKDFLTWIRALFL